VLIGAFCKNGASLFTGLCPHSLKPPPQKEVVAGNQGAIAEGREFSLVHIVVYS